MRYRELGKTGLKVSEIGLGGEWLEGQSAEAVKAVIDRCEEAGINILDCWMPEPQVRRNIGAAIREKRERWVIQGHIGSTWQNGQYVRTRDMSQVVPAFEDLLEGMQTSYIDLGMIHYIDSPEEFDRVMAGEFGDYVRKLKADSTIRHIGLSTHNPEVGLKAVESGEIEMILFSINPAFDLRPPSEDLDASFELETYRNDLAGIDPVREKFYQTAEAEGIGLTVMKGYFGGRLFKAETSPFGVAMTPVQCLHYALTRPAVASVMAGFSTPQHVDEAVHYEDASDDEKDYASVLASAPSHAFSGQCTYCGHCQPCPAGINIAMANKLYDLAAVRDEVPPSVREHYKALDANAFDCIGCGSCESRCPFGVAVVDKMAAARELFG